MLHLHRSERADALVERLGAILAEPLEDPFAVEVVAVPTRGIERWLAQQLATVLGAAADSGDGVCANVAFPFPERLLAAALDAARPHSLAAGRSAGDGLAESHEPGSPGLDPSADPWSPSRSVWPLIDVVEGCSGAGWLEMLRSHLERGDGTQRFAALRHVADLFDRYAVHRPAMVRAWAEGRDCDASGAPLQADAAWQAELWRRLRERIGVPSSAERLVEAVEALRAGEVAIDLPARVSLFGLTRLPPSYLEVLHAVAARRDVHLFLLHPSPALWSEIAAGIGAAQATGAGTRRRDDPTVALARHPLLASWGRDAREMQLVLAAGAGTAAKDVLLETPGGPGPAPRRAVQAARAGPAAALATGDAGVAPAQSLLERLQADVRENRLPAGEPFPGQPDGRFVLRRDDDSVAVHDCHGRGRQVEVVRDAILHLLARDETLEPRDVIVMCPDIESWAPLIRAAFDPGGPPGPPGAGRDETGASSRDLRARLADRSLRQTNPLFAFVGELLALPGSRLRASQVLDLAAMGPVRRRFGFDDAELARLRSWVEASGVRWGLDAAHRQPFGLELLEANTWRAGLDRLLVGVAASEAERRLVGGVLPLEDVASNDVELAGRLAELVERLAATVDELGTGGPERKPLSGWVDAIRRGLDRLALCAEPERWQRLQVDRLLAEVVGEAAGAAPGEEAPPGQQVAPIALAELRSLLADRLRGRPSRANFRTGHLTICTLVPMRSVPHRVVCLLGMDDGAFPRQGLDDGDDLVGRDPWVGDRDGRSEDRQLLLDALLAAREHLVVTYRGRDERTNATRPPCVPLGELLDVIDATARPEQPGATTAGRLSGPSSAHASAQVVVRHPLQAFDARCFVPDALAPIGPWSFDEVNLRGALAAAGTRRRPAPFLEHLLEPLEEGVVELAALVRFFRRPVGELLRRRLGLRLGDAVDEPADGLPIELDPLEAHQLGERLLQGRLAGLGAEDCAAAERARGELPAGVLGEAALAACEPTVESLVAAWRCEVAPGVEPRSLDVRVELGDGTLLAGSVPGVHGDVLAGVSYARLSAPRRLQSWVQLLALAASGCQIDAALTIGRASARRDGGQERVASSRLEVGESAPELLEQLVALYRAGLREPLPLFCRTSEAWASARRSERDPLRAARAVFEGAGPSSHGERDDPEHRLVLGAAGFDEVIATRPGPEESGAGWQASEPSRFGRLAVRVWEPLLDHEQVSER